MLQNIQCHTNYYSYYEFNRLSTYYEGAKETPADNEKIKYEYNDRDQVVKIDYPEAAKNIKSVLYEYDNRARISRIKATTSSDATLKTVREYTYSPKGNVETIKDFTGFDTGSGKYILRTYTYDKFDRVTKMSYANNDDLNTPVEEYNYTYDKNNNILTEDIKNNYVSNNSIDELKEYTYDSLGRLTNVKVTDRTSDDNVTNKSYTYDKVGNRKTETDESGTKTYSYNNLNELLNIKKDDNIITSYIYDENGNEIKEVSGNIAVEKCYDVNNQMNMLYEKENNKITFIQENEYNYNEQRTKKRVCPINELGSGTSEYTDYYYSNGSLLYTEGNKKGYKDFDTANILNLAGNVISTVRENESDPFDENIYFYSYNKDIRNSTSSVVDDNNSGIVAYEYDDFGNTEVVGDTNFNNEICYTGGIYDKEIGEYYLNARHYDPETARFTTVDTYRGETEEPATLHLYAYCANNPINFVDPSGHKKRKFAATWLYSPWAVVVDGHVGFTARKATNNWSYCSWGKNKKVGGRKVGEFIQNQKYNKVKNLNAINKNYRENKGYKIYKSGLKFFGSFQGTINKYREIYNNESYKVSSNNCVQVACRCLQEGTFKPEKGRGSDQISKEIKNKFKILKTNKAPSVSNRQLRDFLNKPRYKNYYKKM